MMRTLLSRRYRYRFNPAFKKYASSLDTEKSAAISMQFTPDERELLAVEGYSSDPLHEEDGDIHPLPFVVHKYPNKILLLTTTECPVFCRFCTRKRKTLMASEKAPLDLYALGEYIERHPEVNEVIFSGGDPLMLSDGELEEIFLCLQNQAGIKFIRIHTRVVTTLNRRINKPFLQLLRAQRGLYHLAMVLHINHPAEVSEQSIEKIKELKEAGVALYSQSVLLRGVNDNAEILGSLFLLLSETGVHPYYLHQLDKIEGSHHFYVPIEEGVELMKEVRTLLPPYMLPRYVSDSKSGKINLFY